MLADVALEPPNDSLGDVLAVEPEEGYLTLSTIHGQGPGVARGVFDLGG
jgi:hypothetical protein